MSVLGFQVDFVSLRTDEYDDTSRIPRVVPAPPEEDALRRDFTVNALFYNALSDSVEDFTGQVCTMRVCVRAATHHCWPTAGPV